MAYTKMQMKYIDSVEGRAHQSAVEIIGELERRLEELDNHAQSVARFQMGNADLLCVCIAGQKALADLMDSILEKGKGGGKGGDVYQLFLEAQAANEQMVAAIETAA